MSPGPPMRREPVQARAKERIERILDAAEQVFVDVGYENASTNAIAARAETSIGSIYEFFPNKQAVAAALAERYRAQLGALYDEAIVDLPGGRDEIVGHIVDELRAFYDRHPGVGPLLRGTGSSEELRDAGESLQVDFVRHLEQLIHLRRAGESTDRIHLVAEVLAELTRALMDAASARQGPARDAYLRETRDVMTCYISHALPRD